MPLFAAALALVLVLAFPSQDLSKQLAKAQRSDLLTISYLRAWLSAKPDDWPLHLTLARHLTLIGRYDEALQTLALIRGGERELRRAAEHQRLVVLERKAWSLPEDSPERAELLAEISRAMRVRGADTASGPAPSTLIEQAMGIDDPKLAIELLRNQVADPRVIQPVAWFVKMAGLAQAQGELVLAAQCFWRAFDASTEVSERRTYLRGAMQSMRWADRVRDFLNDVEPRLPLVNPDRALYEELVKLALGAQRQDLAEQWARAMLRFSMLEQWLASVRGSVGPDGSSLRNSGPRAWGETVMTVGNRRLQAGSDVSGDRARPARGPDKNRGADKGRVADKGRGSDKNRVADKGRDADKGRSTDKGRIADRAGKADKLSRAAEKADKMTKSGKADNTRQADGRQAFGRPPAGGREATPAVSVGANWVPSSLERPAPGAAASAPRTTTTSRPTALASAAGSSSAALSGERPAGGSGSGAAPVGNGGAASPASSSGSATPPASSEAADPSGPQLPFDESAYKLAFDVFVGNRNLADALRVAESAVRQAPGSRVWRERLAQVAEWSSRSPIALAQWLHIAQTTQEKAAWEQVKRLAQATHDHDALMTFLKWEVLSNPPSDERDLKVAGTYEYLGEPQKAIDWLRARIEARGPGSTQALRNRVTDLAEISGKVGLLEQQLRASLVTDGPRPELSIRLANLLYGQGRLPDALTVLQPLRAMASDPQQWGEAQERQWGYWDLHTRLATRLQREDDAILSFLQLLRLRSAGANELRELSLLAEGRSLRAAADVSEFSWYSFRDADQLERTYGLLLQLRDYPRLERLLETLTPVQRDRFESDPSLLRARADHRQAAGRFAEARRDLERSIELAPGEPQGPAQLIWLLLAQRDSLALQQALRRFEALATSTPVLWAPYGAAFMLLNEPQRAVPFFHRKAREANDYLWWLAYADALADAGRHDAAWTLRRRAWTELRPAAIAGTHDARMASRERVVGLALQFSPSDDARALLQGMLGEVGSLAPREPGAGQPSALAPTASGPRSATPLPADLSALGERIVELLPTGRSETEVLAPAPKTTDQMQAAVRELVVSYLMTRESFDAARGWLLSRYADDLSRPAWAQLALALVARDRVRLERLLDDMPDWLPKLESIDAMRVTRRYASAQTLAFETLGSRPDNPDAHQRVLDNLGEAGSFAQATIGGLEQGALRIHGLRSETAWALTQGWTVLGEFDVLRMQSSNQEQLTGLPGTERRFSLGVRRPVDDGWWLARLSHRDGLRGVTGGLVQWQLGTPGRWLMAGAAGLRQTATELALLRAGASKDHLDVRLTWEASPREYIALNLAGSRFRTLLNTPLGEGMVAGVELGHRLRIDYPDITVRLSLVRSNYSAERQPDALITGMVGASVGDPYALWVPASSSQANLSLAVGESSNFGQTRAIRPYFEAGLRNNSLTGTGYNLRAGLTGSLLGGDRLTVFASTVSAVPGNPRGSRELAAAYRWRY